MEIPVTEKERKLGTLSVESQGLYTRFTARIEGEGEGLTRLWLCGGHGRPVSLGLLEPGAGERRLCRRLTRLELRALPPRPWTALVLPAGERPCARPAAERQKEGASAWERLADGSLYDAGRGLLALPWGGGRLPRAARKISLEGRDYWVFRT